MTAVAPRTASLVSRGIAGAAAGIAGGIVFGMLMAMRGMLPMIAGLVGSSSPVVGALVHLVISAGIGALFGLLAAGIANRIGPLLAAGAGYGVVWWVLGPLLIMPAMLGKPLFALNKTAVMSLMGHVVYGLVTAAVLYGIRRRSARA
jgi:uncharacterized membrane protein YagU involved in acid resistance